MFQRLGNRGQEEAPFELMIAVIVMGFVLLIGLSAMNELQKQKCNNDLEAKLEDLKTKIEIVINQKSPQLMDFSVSSCYNPQDEVIKVVYNERANLCADFCSSGTSICRFLEYYNQKAGVQFRKCLNINPQTVFGEDTTQGGQCENKRTSEKKIAVDLQKGIPRGIYNLYNKETTSSFPIVCAYCNENSACGKLLNP